MKKRFRLLQVLMLFTAVFLMLGSVTFAWFSKTESTSVIKFDTASLKVDANLYYYYGNTPTNDDYILAEDSINVIFNNIIPGDKFYFKLEVLNKGTIDGNLSVFIDNNDLKWTSNLEEGIFILNDDLGNSKDISFTENTIISNSKVISSGESTLVLFEIEVSHELTSDNNPLQLIIKGIKVRLDQIRE